MTEPSSFSATVWFHPAAIAVTPLCAAAGTFIWLKDPHDSTEPSLFKARVWPSPAAIATTPVCAATGTLSWPEYLFPHDTAEPAIAARAVLVPDQLARRSS